jgi:hypothetical protein
MSRQKKAQPVSIPPRQTAENGTGAFLRTRQDVEDGIYVLGCETASKVEGVGVKKNETRKSQTAKRGKAKSPREVGEKYVGVKQLGDPKSKFYMRFEIIIDEIIELFKFGLTHQQIAQVFNYNQSAFQAFLESNPELKNKLDSCRKHADSRVVAALYKIACGEVAVHERAWEELTEDGTTIRHKQKLLAPNAYAALQWLSRRDPAHWSESEVVKKQIAQEFDEMSDEQLSQMVERIMSKATSDEARVHDESSEDESTSVEQSCETDDQR